MHYLGRKSVRNRELLGVHFGGETNGFIVQTATIAATKVQEQRASYNRAKHYHSASQAQSLGRLVVRMRPALTVVCRMLQPRMYFSMAIYVPGAVSCAFTVTQSQG